MGSRAAARIHVSRRELGQFRRELGEWLDTREARDTRGQYRTQLATLGSVLRAGLVGVEGSLDGVDAADPVGGVYAACGEADRALLWVRRVWDYFRTKFDQRDDPALAPLLAAADEVVWSCWAEPLDRAGLAMAGQTAASPAPLPYVEAFFAPQAFLRDRPPPELQLPAGVPAELRRDMNDFLRRLPIPVVALPAASVRSPWWLALLAHEVAHHLQVELVAGWGLVSAFGEMLQEAAAGAGMDDADAWRSRGEEVFADAMSVFAIGPAALWITAEALLDTEAGMLRGTTRYPAPVVRLALLHALCREAGVPAPPDLVPEVHHLLAGDDDSPTSPAVSDSQARSRARAQAQQAGALAGRIAAWTPEGLDRLAVLAGWDAARFANDVSYWSDMLDGQHLASHQEERHAARTLAAATALACASAQDEDDFTKRVKEITDRALPLIAMSREPGTRAAARPAAPPRDLGSQFVELLGRTTTKPAPAHE